ncbi:hypothetical protein P7H56_09350, partial [Vagococcus lutrae]|nr:hypothetical protein [Vagococcus lutrae]
VIPPAIFFYYSTLFDSRFKTLQQNQLAYELRQQGMTYKMVSRKTGISIKTLQRRFKQLKDKEKTSN